MYKHLSVFLIVLVALAIPESNGHVAGNRELEDRLETMWKVAGRMKENYIEETETRTKQMHYSQQMKDETWKITNAINKKFDHHLKHIEQEARRNGKLEHVNLEVTFFKTVLEELEILRKEDIAKLRKEFEKRDPETCEKLIHLLNSVFDKLANCMREMINEFQEHPHNIFKHQTLEELLIRMGRLQTIMLECKIGLDNAKHEIISTLRELGMDENHIRKLEGRIVI